MIPLFNKLNREEADTYSLVLNSVGIGNRVVGMNDRFRIDVPELSVDAAMIAITRYQAENPPPDERVSSRQSRTILKNFSGIVVAIVLLCVHLAVMESAAPTDYIDTFGAHSRRILGGEIYRCATALVLHADDAHIVGNMAGIALFGGAVCTAAGTGVGWLLILGCGILGNLINAFFHETGHLSIGASTAVFAAVGIQCSFQAVAAVRTGRDWKRVILIVGAGAALLAFMGASARSDLGAHLFGFFIGLLAGAVYRFLADGLLARNVQIGCGATAVLTLILAWIRGVLGP